MNLINRVKGILVSPKTEWLVIATENQSMSTLITSYTLPLALVAAAANFIGYGFIWGAASITWGLYFAVSVAVSAIISVVISSYVVDALAPSFGSEKNLNRSAQLVAYGATPGIVGSVLNIFPPIAFIGMLFALYGIYLWYLGLTPIKKTPDDKRIAYLVVCFVVLFVVYFLIGLVFSFLLMPALGLSLAAAI